MSTKARVRIAVALAIALMLAGAYVIVAKNRPVNDAATQQVPSGFVH